MNQPGLLFGSESSTANSWRVPEPGDLPYLTGVNRISLDTETSGTNPFKDFVCGISMSWRDEMLNLKSIYTPVKHREGNMDPDVVKAWLTHVLPGKEVVFTNAKYDIQILRNGFGLNLEALGVIPRDCAFPDALLDDNRRAGHSLEAMSQRYLGRGKLQTDLDMNRIADYPSSMVAEYAMMDAVNTLEIDEITESLIIEQGLDKVLALENSVIYAVCEIERNGCRLDVEKLERWRKEVRDEYEKVVMRLCRQTGMMIQPGSGESMLKLFKYLGIEGPKRVPKKKKGQTKQEFEAEQETAKTNKKKESLPTYEVEELIALKNPVMDMVVQARQLDSLLSKFLDKYHDGLDGDILRAQYHQLKSDEGGTVRGRFSSSGGGDLSTGYSFNSQQVIKTSKQQETTGDRWIIRELFIPDEGMRWCGIDASQIEYRIAAALAGAEKIIKAYQDDPTTDYHAMTTAAIQRYRPTFHDRTITKNANFAFVFGAAAETMARTASITIKESKEILDILGKIFPEAPKLLTKLAQEAETQGFVTTILGRRARFAHKNEYHKALNAVVQGSAADAFKLALKAVYDERKTLGIHKLRQIVHDEINADILPDTCYTEKIKDFINQQRVNLRVPIRWNLAVGNNWKEVH